MRVLVAGGTGFVGSHIVRNVLSSYPDAMIRILGRRFQAANPWGPRVEYAQGSVTQPATLPPFLRGIDVVIDCVEFPNHPIEDPSRGWTYLAVDGVGTRNLITASREARVHRFIYLSCAGLSSASNHPCFVAKRVAEEAVIHGGLEYLILRPSWIYGPGDKTLNRILSLSRFLPVQPIIGSGENRTQPISVFDVAGVATQAVSLQQALNRVYELGGPQELTMNEILQVALGVMGRRRPLLHLPAPLLKFVGGLASIFPEPPLSPSGIDLFMTSVLVETGLAEKVFERRFESLEAGLRRYLAA